MFSEPGEKPCTYNLTCLHILLVSRLKRKHVHPLWSGISLASNAAVDATGGPSISQALISSFVKQDSRNF